MASVQTPRKQAVDYEKNCRLCCKSLVFFKGEKQCFSRRRDLLSENSIYLLRIANEFLTGECFVAGNAYLCMDCVNKLNKYDRVKKKLDIVSNEFEHERKSILNLTETHKRFKRVLDTPQRPRTKEKIYKPIEPKGVSPSKIPVYCGVFKENVPTRVLQEIKVLTVLFGSKFFKITIYSEEDRKMLCGMQRMVKCRDAWLGGQKQARKRLHMEERQEYKASVSFKYPSQLRKRVVDNNVTYTKLVKAMLDDKPRQIAACVWEDEIIRKWIEDEVCRVITKECKSACSNHGDSVLQKTEVSQLLSFNVKDLITQWRNECPLFYKVITTSGHRTDELSDDFTNIATAGAILLKCRNPRMSALSQIIGLLLDWGGAHDKTIQLLCNLGISVSPSTVARKKLEMAEHHDEMIKQKFLQHKEILVDIRSAEDTLKVLHDSSQITNAVDVVPGSVEIDNNYFEGSTCPARGQPIYSNPLLPGVTSSATLGTSVDSITAICKNTEKVNTLIELKPSEKHHYYSETIDKSDSDSSEKLCYSVANSDITQKYTEDFLDICKAKLENKKVVKIEIYGDNCDLRVNTSHQTKENRTKDYHWFLTVASELRVNGDNQMSETRPQRDIETVENHKFIPSVEDSLSLQKSFAFHVMRVLAKNVKFLQMFSSIIPTYIKHPYIENYKNPTEYVLLDLYDKNENKSEDMIDILSSIQHGFVPLVPSKQGKNVIERMVFGGDVLTNERAYQAQLDMANGESESEKLMGFIHRPEGLHRQMNLLKYIFETFYLPSSVNERGTMFQLKCFLDRRDIKLDMTAAYRQCKNFFDDCLDGHVLAAACDYFGIKSIDESPSKNKIPPLFQLKNQTEKVDWLMDVSSKIVENYVLERSNSITNLHEEVQILDTQLKSMQTEDKLYKCPHTTCEKKYKQFHWLKRHMREKHATSINLYPPQHSKSDDTSQYDGIYNVASAFLKVGLLFRDTEDSYKMGDGDRLMRNAKFEMLHFHQGHHIKYRLWLWRMLAYEQAILSEREAFEYKWNMSVNLGGGIGHLIPNDNLVEIHVHLIKEQARRMGANMKFKGLRKSVKCIKSLKELSESMDIQAGVPYTSTRHSEAHRQDELKHIVKELNEMDVFSFTPGREHASFVNFGSDLLSTVNVLDLLKWFDVNKKRAAKEMQ